MNGISLFKAALACAAALCIAGVAHAAAAKPPAADATASLGAPIHAVLTARRTCRRRRTAAIRPR